MMEATTRKVDQVDFIHRHNHVAYTQQRADVAVSARLCEDAFPGVDQDHSRVGVGRSGGHIASVLLVARSIRHDERSAGSRKEAIRHVYSDALLSLGFQ